MSPDDARINDLLETNSQLGAALRAAEAGGGSTSMTDTVAATAGSGTAQQTIEDLRARVAFLEQALRSTEASLSWRITRPLRALKARARR